MDLDLVSMASTIFFIFTMKNLSYPDNSEILSTPMPWNNPSNMENLKMLGISDETISYYTGIPQTEIIKYRIEKKDCSCIQKYRYMLR